MNDNVKIAEPAEDNVTEPEREARARRETELRQAQQEDKGQEQIRPAVTRLKKRRHGRATALFALLAVALIVLAWCSNWIYRSFIRQPPETRQQAETEAPGRTDYRLRTDLGQHTAVQPENEPQTRRQETDLPPAITPDTNRLDKARFLVRRENTAGTQRTVRTRQDEMTAVTSSPGGMAETSKVSLPDTAGTQPVRRIPYDPDLYVPENTAIPCSLDYRFVSDRAGKIRCTVTSDIWSASGNTKLIEKGTTASGIYQTGRENGMQHGQGRAFIIITKLRSRQSPYLDIPLVDTSAAGPLGEAGVDGWIDSHFGQRFGGAMMVSMIPDIAAWASDSAGKKDRNTDYTENSRQAMAEMARTTLENSINIPPTLYKNQGEIISLVTGQDIDFSAIYTLRMKHDR
ncbi:VirB10 family inner membrane type IV secretion channel protein [Trabulsiella guamensis ATCC 49490]|uniref:VirB10 family inner membrane type IV secretion channel protein n=1 Tax=Trabulsiella guamensis ATCC 49490 TaxID=1005994 RepID=A0A085AA72_9ENTR|nr:VirB10/TraB/TrbI family type IV secretion system protein [Trabulsiella guamensis]KFC07117.1 VirB10 family inner membrane type IV secretion channel protein [Trabulsiella guamensis ATCC 49490]